MYIYIIYEYSSIPIDILKCFCKIEATENIKLFQHTRRI